ncbi:DUF4279 domain-containing protein [Luteimonas sp. RC10]|uniref:DUF4279 domain-containing protein n=1 Tax=Luteimonas sp. RC10 TaxID=2587035 RepID=UPI001614B8CB|nr:DUF4279 domain-containing protein [Luteimonas sp. RC10]MBB3344732.1 hypothetical protein [Luteimonas sp. RC10]
MKFQSIAKSISLAPVIGYSAGEIRTTPKGQVLPGVNPATFCVFELIERDVGFFTDGVEQLLPLLARHRELLSSIAATGGSSELYVGVFVDKSETTGFSVQADTMAALAELSIQLSVEIYLERTDD